MAAGDCNFVLVAPSPAELALRSDQDGSGIAIDEQFGDVVLGHPIGVGGHQLDHGGGFAVDWDFARPGQGRPAMLARLCEGTPIFGHLGRVEPPQDRGGQHPLDEHVPVEDHFVPRRGAEALEDPPRALQPFGPT